MSLRRNCKISRHRLSAIRGQYLFGRDGSAGRNSENAERKAESGVSASFTLWVAALESRSASSIQITSFARMAWHVLPKCRT